MKKILGSIFLLIIIYVGFCGIKVETGDKEYKIPPFIANFIKSDEAKEITNEAIDLGGEAVGNIKDSVKDLAEDVAEKRKDEKSLN